MAGYDLDTGCSRVVIAGQRVCGWVCLCTPVIEHVRDMYNSDGRYPPRAAYQQVMVLVAFHVAAQPAGVTHQSGVDDRESCDIVVRRNRSGFQHGFMCGL